MLIPREMLAACLPATNDHDTRYALGSIQVEPSGRVSATNGHVLITALQAGRIVDADFPIVPGGPYHGDPELPILIPADLAGKLIKATPKRSTIPCLSCVQVGRNGSDTTATVSATDLQAPTVATVQTVGPDNRFPEIDRLFPASGKGDRVDLILSVEVLETLIKAAKAVKGRQHQTTIKLTIPTAEKLVDTAIGFDVTGDDGITVSGVAMPCRR